MGTKVTWEKRAFLKAWIDNQDSKDWDSFFSAMAKACEKDCGGQLNHTALSARLGAVERHLTKTHGLQAPRRPKRDSWSKPPTLKDIGVELGLKPLTAKQKKELESKAG
jgi:hypothetical protein|tara:strand:+ start:242 stop:568 length:327 start_codon:yes stop_codon:yes gene_type:complete